MFHHSYSVRLTGSQDRCCANTSRILGPAAASRRPHTAPSCVAMLNAARAPRLPRETQARRPLPSPPDEVIVISSEDEQPRRLKAGKTSGSLKRARGTREILDYNAASGLLGTDKKEQRPIRVEVSATPFDAHHELNITQELSAVKAQLCTALAAADRAAEREQALSVELEALRLTSTASKLAELADELACEVCRGLLWSPGVLRCGHAFCVPCLQSWFRPALAKYREEHASHTTYHIWLSRRRASTAGRPSYTCPTCRAPVRLRPTTDFTLKRAVHAVAAVVGEVQPAVHAHLDQSNLWDTFFPEETSNLD
jgi:hypothetical protein